MSGLFESTGAPGDLEAWLKSSADPEGPAEIDPDARARWVQSWQSPALSVHWPGAAEQAIRLAALDREQLLGVAGGGTGGRNPRRPDPTGAVGPRRDSAWVAAG